jgi:hypothetical protein
MKTIPVRSGVRIGVGAGPAAGRFQWVSMGPLGWLLVALLVGPFILLWLVTKWLVGVSVALCALVAWGLQERQARQNPGAAEPGEVTRGRG